MSNYDGEIFDADNHYYESPDAFTRHVPKKMQSRCVEWIEKDNGRRYQLVGGRINRALANPTFNPISKPGVLQEFLGGALRGTGAELHDWLTLGDSALFRWSFGVINSPDGDGHPVVGPGVFEDHHHEDEGGFGGNRDFGDFAYTARMTA